MARRHLTFCGALWPASHQLFDQGKCSHATFTQGYVQARWPGRRRRRRSGDPAGQHGQRRQREPAAGLEDAQAVSGRVRAARGAGPGRRRGRPGPDRLLRHHRQTWRRRDRARDDDPGARLRRAGPREADRRRAGHPHRDDDAQQTPDLASHVRHPDADLHPSARVGVAAAVRRVRQRHHRPRAEEDLPVPELPGRPHPVVPRPRCALHRAERLLRPGLAVPPARRPGAGAAAAGRVRRGDHVVGHDVRRQRVPAVRRPRRIPGCGATSSWSTAGRGR